MGQASEQLTSTIAGRAWRLIGSDRPSIPLVMCIDVEPDLRVFEEGQASPWTGFEQAVESASNLRTVLRELTGGPVAFTWFLRMDPQIEEAYGSAAWAAETYRDVIDELVAQGDEIGLHVHLFRWMPERSEWVGDHGDPAWAEHCMETGLAAYESAFGRPSGAHRGGDHFLTPEILACLARRSVRVDLTVEPGLGPVCEAHGGRSTDFRGVPRAPYRTSAAAFPGAAHGDGAEPLLIPLFTGPGRRFRRLTLPTSARYFPARLIVGRLSDPPPVFAYAIRSDQAMLPVWDRVRGNLEHMARFHRARFVTASEAAELVDDRDRSSVAARRTAV
jgi:hypothetical protein